MQHCQVCSTQNSELYSIDEFLVCETCLMQGRLDELPAFARAADREAAGEAQKTSTMSSWWNRDIPAGAGR